MYFYELLNKNRLKLNQTENDILNYFLKHSQEANNLTIRQVADHFYTSPNTITRMCKKLGFSGYSNFKESLFLTTKQEQNFSDFTSLDEQLVKTKQLLNPIVLEQVIEWIYSANQVLILGVGLSKLPAEELNHYLQVLDKNSKFFWDPHMMRHAAKKMDADDLVIALSISGNTENILSAVHIAQSSKVKIISLTGFSQNKLSKISDVQLYGMTSNTIIQGIDLSDRLSFHYLVNTIFTEYTKKYYLTDATED